MSSLLATYRLEDEEDEDEEEEVVVDELLTCLRMHLLIISFR